MLSSLKNSLVICFVWLEDAIFLFTHYQYCFLTFLFTLSNSLFLSGHNVLRIWCLDCYKYILSPKRLGKIQYWKDILCLIQNNLDRTKTYWTGPKCFRTIEGQGITHFKSVAYSDQKSSWYDIVDGIFQLFLLNSFAKFFINFDHKLLDNMYF